MQFLSSTFAFLECRTLILLAQNLHFWERKICIFGSVEFPFLENGILGGSDFLESGLQRYSTIPNQINIPHSI